MSGACRADRALRRTVTTADVRRCRCLSRDTPRCDDRPRHLRVGRRGHGDRNASRECPASSTRSLLAGLAANLGLAATKLVVAALTRSTMMVAEGIHSLVDTGNSGLMMFRRRGPDEEHPFGYGVELYFWSFVVATSVFGGGGLSIYQGFTALLRPREITSLWPTITELVIAPALPVAPPARRP